MSKPIVQLDCHDATKPTEHMNNHSCVLFELCAFHLRVLLERFSLCVELDDIHDLEHLSLILQFFSQLYICLFHFMTLESFLI